jgi:hypothetical protein
VPSETELDGLEEVVDALPFVADVEPSLRLFPASLDEGSLEDGRFAALLPFTLDRDCNPAAASGAVFPEVTIREDVTGRACIVTDASSAIPGIPAGLAAMLEAICRETVAPGAADIPDDIAVELLPFAAVATFPLDA